MTTGRSLIGGMLDGSGTRPPYIPVLGAMAARLAQVELADVARDPQVQARALAEAAAALYADVVTVGVVSTPEVGRDVVARLRPLLADRGIAAWLDTADVAAARAYCDAGIDLLFVACSDATADRRLRTIGNAGRFYGVPVILGRAPVDEPALFARRCGLDGALVADVGGDEPGVVGGALSPEHLSAPAAPVPPRTQRFFWSFAGEVPADTEPEQLAALGRRLTT